MPIGYTLPLCNYGYIEIARGTFACINQSRIYLGDLEIVISRVSRHIKSRQRVFHSRAARRLASPRLAPPRPASRRLAFMSPLGHPARVFGSAFERTMRRDATPGPREGNSLIPHERPRVRTRRYYGYFSSRLPALTRYYCGRVSLPPAHRPTKVYCVTL